MRRLALTPAQLRDFLRVLSVFGFTAKLVQVTPEGTVILHAESGQGIEHDPLKAWEAARALKAH